MTPRYRRGLVVGKFAPLHRGHELVIGHASAACDEVVVVSYTRPELPGYGAARRERWLAARFPRARRIVLAADEVPGGPDGDGEFAEVPPDDADPATHRRFVGYLCRTRLGDAVEAVFTSEEYGAAFAAALTEYFERHGMAGRPVRHHAVDPARATVPVSGTALRADVHAGRRWLAPEVYASFVRRICVLGGESSGKTTLAAALAAECGTTWVPEYGRELWERQGGRLAPDDIPRIARAQVAAEEAAAAAANRVLFCDTSPLTTAFYGAHLFGCRDPGVEHLARRRYDLIVLCAPDFPFVQDGTRQDDTFRARQHAWYVAELTRRGEPWVLATGDVAARVRLVREALARLPADAVDP